jgi:hypothetical protein
MCHHKQWQDLASLLAMVGFLVSCNLVNQGRNLSCNGLGLGVGNIVLQQMQGLKECYLLENNLWHLWENLLQNPLFVVFFLKVVDFKLTISNGAQSSIKCLIINTQVKGSCFQEREKEDGEDEPCFWLYTLECARLWRKAFFKCLILDACCDISIDIVSKDELVTFFGKRSSLNG